MPRTGWGKKQGQCKASKLENWFDPLCRELGIPVYADYETKEDYEETCKEGIVVKR